MEIRQLNTLIHAAQLQSFSKTAESLGYSQSAVTVQIKALEEELGVRLFDRMGKRVILTTQGRAFWSTPTRRWTPCTMPSRRWPRAANWTAPCTLASWNPSAFSGCPACCTSSASSTPALPCRSLPAPRKN